MPSESAKAKPSALPQSPTDSAGKQDAPIIEPAQADLMIRSPLFGQSSSGGENIGEEIHLKTEPPPWTPPLPHQLAKHPEGPMKVPGHEPLEPGPMKAQKISEIKGLYESTMGSAIGAALPPLELVMVDRLPAQIRKAINLGLCAAALTFAATLCFVPELRFQALKALTTIHKRVVGTVRRQPSQQRARAQKDSIADTSIQGASAEPAKARKAVTSLKAIGQLSCQTLLSAASSGARLGIQDRIGAADCYLIKGNAEGALKTLQSLRNEVQKKPERDLNRMVGDGDLADAFYTLALAHVTANNTADLGELLRGRCKRWSQSNSCVTKLMTLVARHQALPEAAQALFKTQGSLGDKAQARLWLSGARLANILRQGDHATKRFQLALKSAPQGPSHLRLEIYESYGLHLYMRGDTKDVRTLMARGISDLKPLGTAAFVKLELLHQLAKSGDKTRFLRTSMVRNDIGLTVRKDQRVLDLLGLDAFRTGLLVEFENLLTKTREYYRSLGALSSPQVRHIDQWMIRSLLARGESEIALTKFPDGQDSTTLDATERHLRGVAYAQASPATRYQAWASEDFRKALKIRPNWETQIALGFTLIRSGSSKEASEVIKALDQTSLVNLQKFWLDMLKVEWYLAQNMLPNAQKICEKWIKLDPKLQMPRRYLVDILNKSGKTSLARGMHEDLEETSHNPDWRGERENISSPLGPMALADRPFL